MCDYLENKDIDTPPKYSDDKIGDQTIESTCSKDEQKIQKLRKKLSDISGKKR